MPDPAAAPDTPDGPLIADATVRRFVGYNMKRAFNVIQADLSRTLAPFDLRMLTYTALVLIVDNPGLRQTQLADAMEIERPNLVVILDVLEQRGLITRDRVPTDRRAHALRPTLAGRKLCQKAVAAVTTHERRLMAGIDPAARAALIATLRAIETGDAKATGAKEPDVPRERPHR